VLLSFRAEREILFGGVRRIFSIFWGTYFWLMDQRSALRLWRALFAYDKQAALGKYLIIQVGATHFGSMALCSRPTR